MLARRAFAEEPPQASKYAPAQVVPSYFDFSTEEERAERIRKRKRIFEEMDRLREEHPMPEFSTEQIVQWIREDRDGRTDDILEASGFQPPMSIDMQRGVGDDSSRCKRCYRYRAGSAEGKGLEALVLEGERAVAPRPFHCEMANVAWKYAATGVMDAEEARFLMDGALSLIDEFYPQGSRAGSLYRVASAESSCIRYVLHGACAKDGCDIVHA